MQTQKLEIKKNIIQSAKQEFLDKGFKGASMRVIAKKANVGLSNIYNYFRNKNEIFIEILQPLLTDFEQISEEHNSESNLSLDFYSEEHQKETLSIFMSLIKSRSIELELLLFKASGSSMENFKDTFTDEQTEIGIEYINIMKEKYPHINNNISKLFIHTMSSMALTIMSEIISHKDLSEKEIQHFIEDYIKYMSAGWKALMLE